MSELLLRFDSIYGCWKALTMLAKKSFLKQDPSSILKEYISLIQGELLELDIVYDKYRKINSPVYDMHSKLDKYTSITSIAVLNAQTQMHGKEEKLTWPDYPSAFASSLSSPSPPNSNCSTVTSSHSKVSSVKIQETAAEYATTQVILKLCLSKSATKKNCKCLMRCL